jgi:hypothetical protein
MLWTKTVSDCGGKYKTFVSKIEFSASNRTNVLTTLNQLVEASLFHNTEITNAAVAHNNVDIFIFFFITLPKESSLGNAMTAWKHKILDQIVVGTQQKLKDMCTLVYFRVFTELQARILGINASLYKMKEVIEVDTELREITNDMRTTLSQIFQSDDIAELMNTAELRLNVMRRLESLRDGQDQAPDNINELRAHQIVAAMPIGQTLCVRSVGRDLVPLSRAQEVQPCKWIFNYIHNLNRPEPFFLASYDKVSTKYKLEILAFELQQHKFIHINDLPRFAVQCCDILGTKSIMNVVVLFQEFTHMRGIKIAKIKSKCKIPPHILQQLLQIVNDETVRLCGECGMKCDTGPYCCSDCETARFSFKCSTPGCNSTQMKVAGETAPLSELLSCVKCDNIVAVRQGMKRTRVIDPEEIVLNTSHIPAWTKRSRSAV